MIMSSIRIVIRIIIIISSSISIIFIRISIIRIIITIISISIRIISISISIRIIIIIIRIVIRIIISISIISSSAERYSTVSGSRSEGSDVVSSEETTDISYYLCEQLARSNYYNTNKQQTHMFREFRDVVFEEQWKVGVFHGPMVRWSYGLPRSIPGPVVILSEYSWSYGSEYG